MATPETRGGLRPTAPQYNPANVSAVGGAGQSGTQPARYISGLPYGQGQETMNQQTSAPMAGSPTISNLYQFKTLAKEPVPTLDSQSINPEEPITAGIDVGPGPGSEALTLPGAVPDFKYDDAARYVQALYIQDPSNEDVRRMLELLQAEGRI